MQNTTYAKIVNKIVEELADNVSSAAADCVVENALYIDDSIAMLQFVTQNHPHYNSVQQLASAALASGLDTCVREQLYTNILNCA